MLMACINGFQLLYCLLFWLIIPHELDKIVEPLAEIPRAQIEMSWKVRNPIVQFH